MATMLTQNLQQSNVINPPPGPSSVVSLPPQVSFEDVERLRASGRTDNVRIPHFLQDRAAYAQRLEKIMEVNQLSDPELRLIV